MIHCRELGLLRKRTRQLGDDLEKKHKHSGLSHYGYTLIIGVASSRLSFEIVTSSMLISNVM